VFAGHVGAALIVKRAAPGVGLGKLVAGALLLDSLLGVFVLAGLESVKVPDDFASLHFLRFDFPVSHGLLAALSWSLVALALVRKKWGVEAGNAVGLAVFSHWPLDAIEHEPELPLALGSPRWAFRSGTSCRSPSHSRRRSSPAGSWRTGRSRAGAASASRSQPAPSWR